jgi:hypothetical protein
MAQTTRYIRCSRARDGKAQISALLRVACRADNFVASLFVCHGDAQRWSSEYAGKKQHHHHRYINNCRSRNDDWKCQLRRRTERQLYSKREQEKIRAYSLAHSKKRNREKKTEGGRRCLAPHDLHQQAAKKWAVVSC